MKPHFIGLFVCLLCFFSFFVFFFPLNTRCKIPYQIYIWCVSVSVIVSWVCVRMCMCVHFLEWESDKSFFCLWACSPTGSFVHNKWRQINTSTHSLTLTPCVKEKESQSHWVDDHKFISESEKCQWQTVLNMVIKVEEQNNNNKVVESRYRWHTKSD